MNIGIVTQWFASGAGHVSRSYEEVLKQKHQVFIYARGGPNLKGDSVWDGPNVTWAPHHPCLTGINSRHFKSWVKRHRIDAVLFNEQRHWAGVVLAKKLGLLTGAYIDYYTQETVPFFDLYDFLICNTRRHYSVFKAHPQCVYIPWGTSIAPQKTKHKESKRPLTFIISSGWDGKYAAGRPYMDRRGTGLTLRAFRRLEVDCRLIVYSQVPLAQCPADWQACINADPRIEFRVGTFMPFPYYEGDVYLYPSRLDGIGLTLPEALSHGLAAITTDNPPMNEFVRNGENGQLVAVKTLCSRPDGYYWPESICDEDALAEKMQMYIKQPELAVLHGQRALELAKEELNWEKNASNLCDWIWEIKPLNNYTYDLAQRSKKYDRHKNPTALNRISVGSYLLLTHLREIIFDCLPKHKRRKQ